MPIDVNRQKELDAALETAEQAKNDADAALQSANDVLATASSAFNAANQAFTAPLAAFQAWIPFVVSPPAGVDVVDNFDQHVGAFRSALVGFRDAANAKDVAAMAQANASAAAAQANDAFLAAKQAQQDFEAQN